MNDTSAPAFPFVYPGRADSVGMSLRDWFAGQAMAAIMSNSAIDPRPAADVASDAYLAAEAMLKERAK